MLNQKSNRELITIKKIADQVGTTKNTVLSYKKEL